MHMCSQGYRVRPDPVIIVTHKVTRIVFGVHAYIRSGWWSSASLAAATRGRVWHWAGRTTAHGNTNNTIANDLFALPMMAYNTRGFWMEVFGYNVASG